MIENWLAKFIFLGAAIFAAIVIYRIAQELLTWALVKFSDEGWQSDESLFVKLDTKLGEGYVWSSGPGLTGGTIRMQTISMSFTRTPSTVITSGKWETR